MPGSKFWLINISVWYLMTLASALVRYRQYLDFKTELSYWQAITYWVPWWTPWVIIAPVLVAIINAVPFRRYQHWRLVGFNLLLLIGTELVYCLFALPIGSLIKHGGLQAQYFIDFFTYYIRNPFYFDLIIIGAIMVVGYVRLFDHKAVQEEIRNRELAHQLVETQLESLKSQLNPHFLFNTLNSIASLIRQENKDNALLALSELSQMLRTVLEHQNSQMVTLRQELDFIQSFLTLQKMRFSNKFVTQFQIEPKCLMEEVPFMLLQPMLENAVKHSSRLESDENLITLNIHQDGEWLRIEMRNRFLAGNEQKGFGIGMENSRKRLARMYDQAFELKLQPGNDGYFTTQLAIPAGEHHA